MRVRLIPFALAIALVALVASTATSKAIDWPTYQLDNTRGGYDSTQPGLASVATGWSSGLTGTLMASPIIVGTRVFVATEGNWVYAFDTAIGSQQWKTSVGTAVTSGWGCGQSFGGITSSPVADIPNNRLYVAGLIDVAGTVNYYLTALNLATGAIVSQTKLAPSGLDWVINGQRGALALANGYVYVPFGGRDGDCGTYHGWVVGVNTTTLGVISFETDTATIGDAIWATSGPAVDASTGDLLVATGQGSCLSSPHQAQSVLRLSPTLAVLDTFTEPNWNYDDCHDIDLGSVGPLLLGGGYAFIVGKQSVGYIIRVNNLGGIGGQAFGADVCNGGMAFGGTAYAPPYIFVACDNGLVALTYNATTPSFAVAWRSNFWATPPIVAAGVVWTTNTGGSGLYAFDLATGNVRYHSAAFSVNHFGTAAESAGTIFVPGSSTLLTFQINGGSAGWRSLGGYINSSPQVAATGLNQTDLFVRGSDNRLWHHPFNGTTWGNWQALGGVMNSDPAVVASGGHFDVFTRGTDNHLWQTTFDGVQWIPWRQVDSTGIITSTPTVCSPTSGRFDIFVRGTDNQLWHKIINNGVGTSFTSTDGAGGILDSEPSCTSWGGGRMDVFIRGTDKQLWRLWTSDSTNWHTWARLGNGVLGSRPSATTWGINRLDVYITGTDSRLWHIATNDATNWSNWSDTEANGGLLASPPSASARGQGVIDVVIRGTDHAVWYETVSGS
jgi:polyvinyl alcohol dehydrogenase (cytochrome)